jgi:hypothetical protein
VERAFQRLDAERRQRKSPLNARAEFSKRWKARLGFLVDDVIYHIVKNKAGSDAYHETDDIPHHGSIPLVTQGYVALPC